MVRSGPTGGHLWCGQGPPGAFRGASAVFTWFNGNPGGDTNTSFFFFLGMGNLEACFTRGGIKHKTQKTLKKHKNILFKKKKRKGNSRLPGLEKELDLVTKKKKDEKKRNMENRHAEPRVYARPFRAVIPSVVPSIIPSLVFIPFTV